MLAAQLLILEKLCKNKGILLAGWFYFQIPVWLL